MTLDRKRWAQLASELQFSQLDTARKQAEVWRAALATLTALLTAVFVLRGRDNVSDLAEPYQAVVVALLGLALALLLVATLWVSRALAGPAGEEVLLTGERVEQWTKAEVGKISTALRWAPLSAAVGVVAVAAATGVTWLAPVQQAAAALIQVTESTGQQSCGQLIGVSDRQLIVRPPSGPVLIPLTTVTAITPVTSCPS